MFFCEYILEICRNWLLATGQQYCFGTMMEVFLQTIPTTLLNRTPTSTLHRVFHLSRTTTKMMTIRLNSLTLHRHHHTFRTFLCQMNRIRRIPAFLLMMIIFTHRSIHHHDQMMTCQMMRCILRQMNHLIYHHIHHHHLIILNHHFLEPLAFLLLQIQLLCPIRFIPPNIEDTPMIQSTKRPPGDPPIPPDTEYQTTTGWSTDTTCN